MNHETPEVSVDPSRMKLIAGSHNLRDMGGYQASDGRKVKWNTLFRAGIAGGLGEADRAAYCRLGIVAIVDLRANHERQRHPVSWHHGENIEYHIRDYDLSTGDLGGMNRTDDSGPATFEMWMRNAYREFPFEQADSYRNLFRLLVAGRVPVLFNCSAGKDRTGIAAALILFALGVPFETIEYDYLLTNSVIEKLEANFLDDPEVNRSNTPREYYLPLLRADRSYLASCFEEVERVHGTITKYIDAVLGVGPNEIELIRDSLLE